MTDEAPPKSAASEPSMEDILASIRRILAEDTAEQADKPASAQPLTANLFDGEAESGAAPPDDDLGDIEDEAVEAAPPPTPTADVFVLTPEMLADADPQMPNETRLVPPPAGELHATGLATGGRRIVSPPAADVSADVLSQLAKAILDRRDIAVATRDVTLEGMVREMLRPLLREWLDRNLPYLIERLVKKEIDLMVNRAERLDD